MKAVLLVYLLTLFSSTSLFAMDRMQRMGIGISNQLVNDIPAISFKLQQSHSFAIGGLLAYDSDDKEGGYGAGLRVYRTFFEEPYINFYGAFTGALINQKTSINDETGFQFDINLGSEFSFNGLESLGLSFEFGLSVNKLDEFVVQTSGSRFFVTAIHFYL